MSSSQPYNQMQSAKRTILVELTLAWKERCEEAFERKCEHFHNKRNSNVVLDEPCVHLQGESIVIIKDCLRSFQSPTNPFVPPPSLVRRYKCPDPAGVQAGPFSLEAAVA